MPARLRYAADRKAATFPGAMGRIKPEIADKQFPRWKNKQTEATHYAIPWKCAPYWLVVTPETWEIMSTLQFRSEYDPANECAKATLFKHLTKHRKRMGFYYQKQKAFNTNAI